MQSYVYGASAPVLPQDQGFQPLAAAASGAPSPILMPGQPYGYSGGMPTQSPYTNMPYQPQQQYQQFSPAYPMQQQVYPIQQQYQQYPGPQQFPQYTAPQQFQPYPQAPYAAAPMYGGLPPPSSGFQYPNSGYSQGYQGRPNTTSGFNMSSGLMGLAAGAVGGAMIDHMVTGHHNNGHHNQGYQQQHHHHHH